MLKRGTIARGALALATGAACALLVACGSSSNTAGLIPTANAGPLKADFELVARAATHANGDCTKTEIALAKTERDFNKLPTSVNAQLRQRLGEGIENLRTVAIEMCSQPPTGTTGETNTSPRTTTTETTTTPGGEEETGGAPVPPETGGEEKTGGGAGGGISPEENGGAGGSAGGAGGTEVR